MSQNIHRRKIARQKSFEDPMESKENTPQTAITPSWKKFGTPRTGPLCGGGGGVGSPHPRAVGGGGVTPVSGRVLSCGTPNSGTPINTPNKARKTPTSLLHARNDSFDRRSPLSPLQNLMDQMRSKVDRQLFDSKPSTPSAQINRNDISLCGVNSSLLNTPCAADDNVSPGLARLRNTPVGVFKAKQELLVKKHLSAKSRADSLCVGGGVSLWPEMERMRLTPAEGAALVVLSVGLVVLSVCVFHYIHGTVHHNLALFYLRASTFSEEHVIIIHSGAEAFNTSVLQWHTAYTALMDDVHATFDVTIRNTTVTYQLLGLLYVIGLGVLIYYLVDNIWAKSKLTPKRIRVWVCILAVIGTWTLMGLQLLVLAQALESALELNVHRLSEVMADLVYTDLDLSTYHVVLLYWRTRMLPPTTRGSLWIMGVVAVRDVAIYLQYYSLPVITALLTPIVQLVLALKDIYWIKTHH